MIISFCCFFFFYLRLTTLCWCKRIVDVEWEGEESTQVTVLMTRSLTESKWLEIKSELGRLRHMTSLHLVLDEANDSFVFI